MTKIAVLDTGIVNENNNFKIKQSLDFTKESKIKRNASDDNGHGTACAKIIMKNNQNVIIYALKVLDKEKNGKLKNLEKALEYLLEVDVDIINMSLNFNESKFINNTDKLCQRLSRQGKILVASADNRGMKAYPAMLASVIGVEGYTFNDTSTFGFYPERKIQAIANNSPIVIEWMDKKTIILGGTSKACALMTNNIAKIIQKNDKRYTFKELLSNSHKSPKNRLYTFECMGKKRLNCETSKNYDSKLLKYIISIIPCSSNMKQFLYTESLYSIKFGLGGEDFTHIMDQLLQKYNVHITEELLAYSLFYSIYSLEKFIRRKIEDDR